MVLAVCANPSVDSFWSVCALRQGTPNRSTKETYHPGGKGIHVVYALQELGEEVTVLGIWGGQTGKWLKKQCHDKGIATIGPSVEEWNRLCISIKADTRWNETELLGAGPTIDKTAQAAFYKAYNHFIKEHAVEAVIMSGSVPADFGNKAYQPLVTKAQDRGIPAFVDASGQLLERTLEIQPHAVHINHHEGRELCAYQQPAEIARWLGKYCEIAAVTAGADGLYLWVDKQLFSAYNQVDPSKVISTVGAGDCLFAGLCQAVLNNKDASQWTRYATACGTANCIYPPLGMLKKKDVESLMRTVTMRKLKKRE